ncbi:MAG: hypothetical protein J6P72_04765 [Firmicutes bacterium]|nr:hypothetical protein [Bacillota bacterium]
MAETMPNQPANPGNHSGDNPENHSTALRFLSHMAQDLAEHGSSGKSDFNQLFGHMKAVLQKRIDEAPSLEATIFTADLASALSDLEKDIRQICASRNPAAEEDLPNPETKTVLSNAVHHYQTFIETYNSLKIADPEFFTLPEGKALEDFAKKACSGVPPVY